MDAKRYKDDFEKLSRDAENSAEVFGSEKSRELLTEAGVREPSSVALIMQLAQEKFLRTARRELPAKDFKAIRGTVEDAVLQEIRGRIGDLTEEKRRGILLRMTEQAAALSRRSCTESDLAAWARAPEEILARSLAAEITRCAQTRVTGLEEEVRQVRDDTGDTTAERPKDVSATAAAASLAALRELLRDRDTRVIPEGVASTSAAAAAIADAVDGESGAAGPDEELAMMIGSMVLLTAGVLIVSILFADVVGVGAAVVCELLETGAPLAMGEILELFVYGIKSLATELKIIGGVGAAGGLLAGLSYLKNKLTASGGERAPSPDGETESQPEETTETEGTPPEEDEEDEDFDPEGDRLPDRVRGRA